MLNLQKSTLEIYFNFFCRTTRKLENKENPIVLRIVYRGQRKDVFTGLSCPSKYWLKGERMVSHKHIPAPEINRQIQSILMNANQAFQNIKYTRDEFTIDELVDLIKGKTPPPQTILEYFSLKEADIQKRVGSDLAKPTFYKYKRTIRYLNEFMQKKRAIRNIPVSKIDEDFLKEFFQFLRKEKGNSNNSACALMGCLSGVLHPAIKNKVIKVNPFTEGLFTRKPVDRDFLELNEIKRIQNLENLTPELKMKRDIFIFACFTGLPYGDLKKLSREFIIEDNDGSKFIKHPRKKNGRLSIIPLLPVAESILESYSPTGDCRDFKWNVCSNQKFNAGLKTIATLAKIDKSIFVHLGRHTFATTVTLTNGVSLESVGNMLGHTSLKHTQIYAKVVAAKVKNEMRGLMQEPV